MYIFGKKKNTKRKTKNELILLVFCEDVLVSLAEIGDWPWLAVCPPVCLFPLPWVFDDVVLFARVEDVFGHVPSLHDSFHLGMRRVFFLQLLAILDRRLLSVFHNAHLLPGPCLPQPRKKIKFDQKTSWQQWRWEEHCAPKVHLVRPRQNVSVVSWPCHTGEPLHSLGVVYFSGVAFVHREDPHRFIVAARDNLPTGGRVVEWRHGSHMVDVNVDRTFKLSANSK